MKISGKGIAMILVFLIGIPFIIDLALAMTLPNGRNFGMSKLLSLGYLNALPLYIGYLIIAFTVIYLIKKWKKSQIRQDD